MSDTHRTVDSEAVGGLFLVFVLLFCFFLFFCFLLMTTTNDGVYERVFMSDTAWSDMYERVNLKRYLRALLLATSCQ